jgi:hypothetical protein
VYKRLHVGHATTLLVLMELLHLPLLLLLSQVLLLLLLTVLPTMYLKQTIMVALVVRMLLNLQAVRRVE